MCAFLLLYTCHDSIFGGPKSAFSMYRLIQWEGMHIQTIPAEKGHARAGKSTAKGTQGVTEARVSD